MVFDTKGDTIGKYIQDNVWDNVIVLEGKSEQFKNLRWIIERFFLTESFKSAKFIHKSQNARGKMQTSTISIFLKTPQVQLKEVDSINLNYSFWFNFMNNVQSNFDSYLEKRADFFSWGNSQYLALNTKIRKEELFSFIKKFLCVFVHFLSNILPLFFQRPVPLHPPKGNSHRAHKCSSPAISLFEPI